MAIVTQPFGSLTRIEDDRIQTFRDDVLRKWEPRIIAELNDANVIVREVLSTKTQHIQYIEIVHGLDPSQTEQILLLKKKITELAPFILETTDSEQSFGVSIHLAKVIHFPKTLKKAKRIVRRLQTAQKPHAVQTLPKEQVSPTEQVTHELKPEKSKRVKVKMKAMKK